MKKITNVLLSGILVASLAGCTDKKIKVDGTSEIIELTEASISTLNSVEGILNGNYEEFGCTVSAFEGRVVSYIDKKYNNKCQNIRSDLGKVQTELMYREENKDTISIEAGKMADGQAWSDNYDAKYNAQKVVEAAEDRAYSDSMIYVDPNIPKSTKKKSVLDAILGKIF